MFKIMNNEAPNYLLNMIPKSQQAITTRNNYITNYGYRTDCFKYSFFLPSIFHPIGLKLLTRLLLSCSYLNDHKFRHNFQDCLNPLCSCSLEIEDSEHYLLHCHHFSQYRLDLIV